MAADPVMIFLLCLLPCLGVAAAILLKHILTLADRVSDKEAELSAERHARHLAEGQAARLRNRLLAIVDEHENGERLPVEGPVAMALRERLRHSVSVDVLREALERDAPARVTLHDLQEVTAHHTDNVTDNSSANDTGNRTANDTASRTANDTAKHMPKPTANFTANTTANPTANQTPGKTAKILPISSGKSRRESQPG
jgi:hypothetical protein